MNVERFIMSFDDDPAVGRPLLDPRAWEDQERERFDFQGRHSLQADVLHRVDEESEGADVGAERI